ncbi:MAG TPA: hypothetical protein VJI98_03760 [Candidatus Nanoarchaeia archaeon]|nr:hypothetical protein [Candidatus Nanoarchaeia archaeon]
MRDFRYKILRSLSLIFLSPFLLMDESKVKRDPKTKEEHKADKFRRIKHKVEMMLDTTEGMHRTAYDAAISMYAKDDKGQVDRQLLRKKEVSENVAKKMADLYMDSAKQQLYVKLPKDQKGKEQQFDEAEETMLMNAIGAATYDRIYQEIRRVRDGFTFKHFYENVRPEMMENLKNNLSAVRTSHFDAADPTKDIANIIQYIEKNAGRKLDFINKDALRLQDAVRMLDEYDSLGNVIEKQHENEHYYLPKEKRKKEK